MLFSASTWTFNVRLGRSGREEGEGVIVMGELSYRAASGERRIHPARAMVVRSDARKRLDLVLSPQECVLTIPLEPFAMQRLQDRLKELISGLRHEPAHRLLGLRDRGPAEYRGGRFRLLVGSATDQHARRAGGRPVAARRLDAAIIISSCPGLTRAALGCGI